MHPYFPRPSACAFAAALLLFAMGAGTLAAQETPSSAVPAPALPRLEILDATYKASLKKVHAPVLQDYLRQLELLRQQLTARSQVSQVKAVDDEIAKIRALMDTTGLMPYTALEKPVPAESTVPSPALGSNGPDGLPLPKPKKALVLHAANSRVPGSIVESEMKEIPLGNAEWTVTSLNAGVYELTMLFAADSLARPGEITVQFAGKLLTAPLPQDRATGSVKAFRLLRLGQIELETDVSNASLLLKSNLGPGQVYMRTLIFAEPRGVKAPQ